MTSSRSLAARRRAGATLVALSLGLVSTGPAFAALASRRACRIACTDLIEFCVASGARRAWCRRNIVRTCRHQGVAWCDVSSTTMVTTTSTSITTTTLDPGPTIHGCNRVEAQDHRGESIVVVDAHYFDYAPECIRVSVGTLVHFTADFRVFPLYGGTVPDIDPSSPFSPPTTSGLEAEFTMDEPGMFPYFTQLTWVALFQMWGAVIVEE
jgi:plastocyanin